jgi:DNA repair photolyase
MKVVNKHRERIIQPCSLEYFEYQLDPYVGCEHGCLYCYTQNDPELDWDTEVGTFPDFRKRLIEELDALEPQIVYFGMNTDPYQPVEAHYRYTHQAVEELAERGFSASILTKSDIFTRDIELLAGMPEPAVGVSLAFNDEDTRALFEKVSMPTAARLRALAQAKAAGVETYVLISPVLPLITDVDSLIDDVRGVADTIWIYPLEVKNTKIRSWQSIERVLKEHFPDVLDKFKEIAISQNHVFWRDLAGDLTKRAAREHLHLEIHI